MERGETWRIVKRIEKFIRGGRKDITETEVRIMLRCHNRQEGSLLRRKRRRTRERQPRIRMLRGQFNACL